MFTDLLMPEGKAADEAQRRLVVPPATGGRPRYLLQPLERQPTMTGIRNNRSRQILGLEAR